MTLLTVEAKNEILRRVLAVDIQRKTEEIYSRTDIREDLIHV